MLQGSPCFVFLHAFENWNSRISWTRTGITLLQFLFLVWLIETLVKVFCFWVSIRSYNGSISIRLNNFVRRINIEMKLLMAPATTTTMMMVNGWLKKNRRSTTKTNGKKNNDHHYFDRSVGLLFLFREKKCLN